MPGIERKILPYIRADVPDAMMAKGFGKSLITRHFVNPDTGQIEEFVLFGQKDWSVVLAVTTDDQVLVVRQFKQGCEKILDELPAGTADWAEETPPQVMLRELKQETGYQPVRMTALQPQWMATRNSWTRFHPFVALGCRKVCEARWDANEQMEPRAVPISEWLGMIFTNQIEEPSAIVTTMLALPYLLGEGLVPADFMRAIERARA